MAVIDRDDRTDHVSGEVSAGAAAEMPGNEAPGVAVQGQAVVEHARPEVPLAVQEHGPDVLAGDGVRIRPVVGEYLAPVSVHQDDAVVRAQPAASAAFGDDAADFPRFDLVERPRGVGEDVGLEDDAAGGGGEDVSRSVRSDVLPGEPFSRAAVDPFEPAVDGVEAVQVAGGGEEPDAAVVVGLDRIAAEEGGRGEVHQGFAVGVPAEDVLVGEPDHPVAVHGDVGRADESAGGVAADGPGFPGREVMETDAPGGDEPQPVLRILRDTHRQAVQDVAGRVFQRLEVQAVVHADALART